MINKSIYIMNFGDKSVRFIMKNQELYVSRTDLTSIIKDCSTDKIKLMIEHMIDKWFTMCCDMHDRKTAVIGESYIGQVMHFHAASNLLDVLSDFSDVASDDLRETGFRIRTLFKWYINATSSANDYFGISLMDRMTSVKNRLNRLSPPFIVNVFHQDMWIAECDDLGIATEASSYDELTEKVWEIAPELYEMNGFEGDPECIRLSFVHNQGADSRMAL